MAHELGYFKQFGIQSVISKEASWAVIRDKMNLGENQATHMLIGMPFASTMGLLGSPLKPMVIPWMINRNGQAITLNNKLKAAGVKSAKDIKPLADKAKAAGDPLTFAMTFPPGTHAMWMRYWLASGGVNPDKDVSLITIPPAQMISNMKVDKMDATAWVNRGMRAIATNWIHRHHDAADVEGSPEKVVHSRRNSPRRIPKTVKAILKGLQLSSVSRQTGKPETCRRRGGSNDIHQLSAGDYTAATDG
jgi:nitrate/nitrite transport system substrate-binding protein